MPCAVPFCKCMEQPEQFYIPSKPNLVVDLSRAFENFLNFSAQRFCLNKAVLIARDRLSDKQVFLRHNVHKKHLKNESILPSFCDIDLI